MTFELVLFYTTLAFAQEAESAGVPTFMIDWEQRGKIQRQEQFDTQINFHTLHDLTHLRAGVRGHIICRLNGVYDGTPAEVAAAIDGGADELLLPMVRSREEIERMLNLLEHQRSRVKLGLMIETAAALNHLPSFAQFPLSRFYVGFNDLAIDRGSPSLFTPLLDGVLNQIARDKGNIPFGFAGLTLPTLGSPIPCRLLIGEMARLGASFSILRRSFFRDIQGKPMHAEIPSILEAMEAAFRRTPEQTAADHAELMLTVQRIAEAAAKPA